MTTNTMRLLLAQSGYEKLTHNPHGFDRVDQIFSALTHVHHVLSTTDDHTQITRDYASTNRDVQQLVAGHASKAFLVLGQRLVSHLSYTSFRSDEALEEHLTSIQTCIALSQRPVAHFVPNKQMTDEEAANHLHTLATRARQQLPHHAGFSAFNNNGK